MKHNISIIFSILVLGLAFFATGCNNPLNQGSRVVTQTDDQISIETVEPTSEQESSRLEVMTETQEIVSTNTPFQQPSETPSPPSTTPTDTPTLTSIGTLAPEPQFPDLGYCHESNDEICIGSFLSVSDKLGMVFKKPNNQDETYILLNNEEYGCVAIPGFTDRYFCTGLPFLSNTTVSIQIFIAGSTTPLAAGEVFIQNPATQPTPTAVPKPPDPYSP